MLKKISIVLLITLITSCGEPPQNIIPADKTKPISDNKNTTSPAASPKASHNPAVIQPIDSMPIGTPNPNATRPNAVNQSPAPTPVPAQTTAPAATPVAFATIKSIIESRCLQCHSATTGFGGNIMVTDEQINNKKARIKTRVGTNSMPQGNATNMTAEERALIDKW